MRTPYETDLLLPVIRVERQHRTAPVRGLPRRRARDVVRAALDRLHPWGATLRPGRGLSRPGRLGPPAPARKPSAADGCRVPTSAG